ncbi:MAG: tRNA-dihydrouridine synthase [Chloroflexi bacterium]|nr:tRNA-dihydrouridine synthase [Chloroflexota bacterium]
MQPSRGFWLALPRPIVALSPMDGVTDVVARAIALRHGQPDLTITEFVSVEGLVRGAIALLEDLRFIPSDRPVIAQLYGTDPSAYRVCATIACALGFDGIDINMGCPALTVANRGAGAALIRNPDLARRIIASVREGIDDWGLGKSLARTVDHPRLRRAIAERVARTETRGRTGAIPVSVKTRIGFDSIEAERWVADLAAAEPAAITLHGRTLKQMYSGTANWDAIGRAAEHLRGSGIVVLGNGDVADRREALARCRDYGVDGVLIGRATIGNPWAFLGQEATVAQRLRVAIEHAELFATAHASRPFMAVRRHLHGYARGFAGASELRRQLMLAPDATRARDLLEGALVVSAAA